MTNFSVPERTIFYAKHGSHAYGLNIASSDTDYKGICIKPKSYYLGFFEKFEQEEKMASKNDGVDSIIYSLDKFARLAAGCNPNIIEVLFVDDSDIIQIDSFGQEIRDLRTHFLSKEAKFTFSGYAYSQLKRIKLHRSWLLNPIEKKPERSDYGLSDTKKISSSELGAYESLLSKNKEVNMSDEMISLYAREKQFQNAMMQFSQYQEWKKNRNEKRCELETNFGYDTKHGMHLIRLMRMCKEILETGDVHVKRDDRDELLAIRFGHIKYDDLIEEAEKLEKQCEIAFEKSSLPKKPDYEFLNSKIVSIVDRYIAND
jgi:uncharacterized protein